MAIALKRKCLSIHDKVAVIIALETGAKNADVVKEFGLSSSSVSTIWKDKEKILAAHASGRSCRKIRRPLHEDLDQAVLRWFREQRSANIPIKGSSLKVKAEFYARQLGLNAFKSSEGWLGKFKNRHRIDFGFCKEVENANINAWAGNTWPRIEETFSINDECNVNETDIVFNFTTDKTLMFKEKAPEEHLDEPDEPPTNPFTRIKCVFCTQILTPSYKPKLLECLHAACANCVNSKIHEQEQAEGEVIETVLECPSCKVTCNTQNIIENQFLLETENEADVGGTSNNDSNKTQDVKCSSCNDNALAVCWCVDCAEFICESCVQAHQRLKITKEHTIKRKEEAETEAQSSFVSSLPKSIFCSVHPQEQLSLFCESCDRLTCRDCQLSEHRDHKYKFIHEIAAETRNVISGLLNEVTYKRVLLKSAMKVIDDRQNLIIEKKKTLVKEITQMVVRLTNAINARGKQLVLRLNEVCDAKQRTLTEKKEALEQLSMLTDHCIDFVTHALDKGSNMALLFSKKAVTSHLQRIKSRRADIPNPEIPVRISLAFEKVPDLIKVVSSIGAIVVDGRVYPSRSSDKNQNPPGDISSPPQVPFVGQAQMRPPTPTITPPLGRNNRVSPITGVPPHQVNRNMGMLRNNQGQHQQTPPQQPQYPYNQGQQGFNQQPQQQQQQISPQQHGGPNQISISPLPPPPPPPLHPGPPQQVPPHMNMNAHVIPPHMMGMRNTNHTQQVTSSTHPGTDPNIRNLLQNPVAPNVQQIYGPGGQIYRVNVNLNSNMNQYKNQNYPVNQNRFLPQQQQQQQQQAAASYNNQSFSQQLRNTMRNHQQPPPPYAQAQQPANTGPQWHIPQQQGNYNQARPSPASMPIDESFKIHLKTQNTSSSNNTINNIPSNSNVTSSVSKTPSPGTSRDDPNTRMDKFCQESVNDLMATIAKLDSNGIEVIPEITKQPGDSLVDSSTSGFLNQQTPQKNGSEPTKEDSNEDWCAVCMDGGELICCDNCPKVFHVNCHIPPLSAIPGETETWQCLLCSDVANLVEPETESNKRSHGLSFSDRKLAERVVLELYCQYDSSIHFRELVRRDDLDYYEKIKKPMALEVVRRRLNVDDPEYYSSLTELIRDVRRIFRNAKIYNPREAQVFQDAKALEEFFERLLTRWLPDYAFDQQDSDEDGIQPPSRKYRRILTDGDE